MTLPRVLILTFLGIAAVSCDNEYDHQIGECPRGWRTAGGRLCYRFIDKKMSFGDALEYCKKMEEDHFDKGIFYEDVSQMLTAQDLHTMMREGFDGGLHDFIWKPIWLNGIKYDGTLYSIHNLPHGYQASRPMSWLSIAEERAKRAQAAGFPSRLFPGFDTSTIENGHALTLEPGWDTRPPTFGSTHYEDDHYHFVCTHKRERRHKWACPGIVTECNNNGYCYHDRCACYPGSTANICTGLCDAATCFDMDTDYPGAGIDKITGVASAEECQQSCTDLAGCLYWSWISPDFEPNPSIRLDCFRKSEFPGARCVEGIISGKKLGCYND